MKTNIYTDDEVAKLRAGGKILSDILGELVGMVRPGALSSDLDAHAERRMRAAGGEPSFKGYRPGPVPPFPGTVCISLNHEVVHGLPIPAKTFKEGDLVKLDIGLRYQGLCTDMAVSVPVGKPSPHVQRLIKTTKAALLAGVDVIKPGVMIRKIGQTVQPIVEREGFSVVRDLVGHGVGHEVHEGPSIPNYDDPDPPKVAIKKGMVLAIEPMVNSGSWQVDWADDQWTVFAVDKKLSAHFEVTVAVTEDGYEILTPLPV
jgi:methionyl aminopeptidase